MFPRILHRPIATSMRRFSSSIDPSIESMESFLLVRRREDGAGGLFVSEVVSDTFIRFPSVDGVGIGSWVTVGGSSNSKGVVVHFDTKNVTVGLVHGSGNVKRNDLVELLRAERGFKFKILPVKFTTPSSTMKKRLITNIPVIDFLLGDCIKAGSTVVVYGK